MHKRTSIEKAIERAKEAGHRFPLALLAAFLGVIIGILFLHTEEGFFSSPYPGIFMTLGLGFPLFIAIGLFTEQMAWKQNRKSIVNGGAIGLLVAYYAWLPKDVLHAHNFHIFRFVLWAVSFVLLVTFVLFLQRRNEKSTSAFWQYNRQMIFSLAVTVLWAVALQAGLSIAMKSIDFLFNINVDGKRYMELWIVLAGAFSTTFFLARIPKNADIFKDQDEYPKELRLFSQYVLVPLVVLYFLILYAYVGKILVLWEWPKGTLAYMILGFSILGVVAYVFLYPLRKKFSWVRRAVTIFYVALIPQIGMLFWALWFRISEYGFTEKRYFVFVFGLWLLAMGIYFLTSKSKDIRIIPITIFVIVILSSFGPWGAFSISERSQMSRLEGILARNGLIDRGIIKKAQSDNKMPQEDKQEILAIIRYLDEMHGLKSINPWFGADITSYTPKYVMKNLIGIRLAEIERGTNRSFGFSREYSTMQEPLYVNGYDYLAFLDGVFGALGTIEGESYGFFIDEKNDFVLTRDGTKYARLNLNGLLDTLKAIEGNYSDHLASDKMKVEFQNEDVSFALHFTHINGEMMDDGTYKINSMAVRMLFSFGRH